VKRSHKHPPAQEGLVYHRQGLMRQREAGRARRVGVNHRVYIVALAVDAASVDDSERFGFRLRNGAIEVQLGARNWQALSDPGTVVVTSFSFVPRVDEADLATFCAQPCSVGSTTCPPRQQVRSYAVSVAGRSAIDALVARELRSVVRVRNDVVVGSCEA